MSGRPVRVAADYAWPGDPATLPSEVRAVLGYVGGDTPHIWSPREIDRVRRTGRVWWPIWTMKLTALNEGNGWDAAVGMAAALRSLAIATNVPVFLDVERSAYVADPAGADACVAMWRRRMTELGYPYGYAYLPWSTQRDWVANWVQFRPGELPAGCVGWQYANDSAGRWYDLSIFDAALWNLPATTGQPLPVKAIDPSTGDDDVTQNLMVWDLGSKAVYIVAADLAHKRLIRDPESWAQLRATKTYAECKMTSAQLAAIPNLP